jgi:hypothetical protein
MWCRINDFTVSQIRDFLGRKKKFPRGRKSRSALKIRPSHSRVISEGSIRKELALSRLQFMSSEIGRVRSGSHRRTRDVKSRKTFWVSAWSQPEVISMKDGSTKELSTYNARIGHREDLQSLKASRLT